MIGVVAGAVQGQLHQAGTLSTQTSPTTSPAGSPRSKTPVSGDGCTIRAYGYDADANRTSLTTKPLSR